MSIIRLWPSIGILSICCYVYHCLFWLYTRLMDGINWYVKELKTVWLGTILSIENLFKKYYVSGINIRGHSLNAL
jgi:hypothetical protein